MCWSGNCLVLFYKTYENTYDGYVRIGHIDDADLADAVGNGDIQVRLSIQKTDKTHGGNTWNFDY